MLTYYTLSYETLLGRIFPACTAFKQASGNNDGVRVSQTLTILDLKDVGLGSASKVLRRVCRPTASSSQRRPSRRTTIRKCSERKQPLMQDVHHQRTVPVQRSVDDDQAVAGRKDRKEDQDHR